jgi:hypothetical protein
VNFRSEAHAAAAAAAAMPPRASSAGVLGLKQKREASDAAEFCNAWKSNEQAADWNKRWFPSREPASA